MTLLTTSFTMRDLTPRSFPDLEDQTYQLGKALTFNPKTERFINDEDANALLTRNYRRPFVVPDEV